jgi:release factor glutamine methyltransferase
VTGSQELLSKGATRLAAAGIESPRAEARILLAHARGHEAIEIFPSQWGRTENDQAAAAFDKFIERREKREPIAYITGLREFWSLQFEVGPGVLIPRPETETLIEEATKAFVDKIAALRVLDIGTGSGCLLAAFLREYPNAHGLGIDASRDALSWARRNLVRHGLMSRARLREGQWTDGLTETFDLIFCNPPYIETAVIAFLDPDVSRFEPRQALDGGADGMDAYRALAPRIGRHLNRAGCAFVELGAGQAGAVRSIFAAAGLETIGVGSDLSGIARCLVVMNAALTAAELAKKTVGKRSPSR